MGMYTEIFISCRIKKNAPEDVITILRSLFDQTVKTDEDLKAITIPEHALFKCPRWRAIGNCSSYYFVPQATSVMWKDDIAGQWFITSRSDLKNYDNEIELFFDWIMPHVDECGGQFIGYSRYEEENMPVLFTTPENHDREEI